MIEQNIGRIIPLYGKIILKGAYSFNLYDLTFCKRVKEEEWIPKPDPKVY